MFTQLRLVYDNPEFMEIAVRKLKAMKQGGKSFSTFISGFEKTMLEAGGLHWNQVKKSFLNTAPRIRSELRPWVHFLWIYDAFVVVRPSGQVRVILLRHQRGRIQVHSGHARLSPNERQTARP